MDRSVVLKDREGNNCYPKTTCSNIIGLAYVTDNGVRVYFGSGAPSTDATQFDDIDENSLYFDTDDIHQQRTFFYRCKNIDNNVINWDPYNSSLSREEIFNINNIPLTTNGYIKLSDGTISETNNAKTTDFIKISDYDVIDTYTSIGDGNVVLAFYNKDKEYLSTLSIVSENNKKSYIVDLSNSIYDNAVYVRGSVYGATWFDKYYLKIFKLNNIENQIDYLYSKLVKKEDVFNINALLIESGFVTTNGGISASSNAKHTGYIDITGYNNLVCSTNIGSSGCALAFYNKNKEFISSISIIGDGIQQYNLDLTEAIYEDAVYVIASCYTIDKFPFNLFDFLLFNEHSIENQLKKNKNTMAHYNTFSVLGDSISTYTGYMKDENAPSYYPDSSATVKSVDKTWWHMFATKYQSRLIENDSWSGSPISYDGYQPGSQDAKEISFIQRANLLTTPELLFVFGGTNDVWIANDTGKSYEEMRGEYIYSDWTDSDLEHFRPALACLFDKLLQKHVGARIIFLLYHGLDTAIGESVDVICEHYNIEVLRLYDVNVGHPTFDEMVRITDQIIQYLNNN